MTAHTIISDVENRDDFDTNLQHRALPPLPPLDPLAHDDDIAAVGA